MGLVPNYGISWTISDKKGKLFDIPKSTYKHSPLAQNMRDQSLIVHGGKIFNILPYDIRNCFGSKDLFKEKLDTFLSLIPDQPASPGLTPAPMNVISCKNSNSLYDWIFHLKLTDRSCPSADQLHSL